MCFFSVKYSFVSFFRDVLRGLWARKIICPRLVKNEFSAERLECYVNQRIKRVGLEITDRSYLSLGSVDLSSCIDKTVVRCSSGVFLRPRSFGTLIRNNISTSGSSGTPLTLTQNLGAVIREEAFVYRQLTWAGYRYGDRRVWLRGDVVSTDRPRNGVYGCRDWWSNTLMLSSYHISNSTAQSYIAALSKFDPVLIQAYPSSIHALASWMLDNNVEYEGLSLRSIVTSSETLDGVMRSRIEKAFGCKVFDWYGQAERVAAIATCEHGSHHALTDYGLVELLPAENGLYELVGSGYNNRAMPLAHYRTGDFVRVSSTSCACGRVFPVIDEVIGRRDKVIKLPDGRLIGRLDHVLKGLDNVVEGQIVYVGEYDFVLRVVPGPKWSSIDGERLICQFNERVADVKVEVSVVGHIPRGRNGKFEFVRVEAGA